MEEGNSHEGDVREEQEGEEGVRRGLRGWGAAMFVQTFTETPIGGGERTRGLRQLDPVVQLTEEALDPAVQLAKEALGSSNVRPSGLHELVPPNRALLGWGGLFAKGDE